MSSLTGFIEIVSKCRGFNKRGRIDMDSSAIEKNTGKSRVLKVLYALSLFFISSGIFWVLFNKHFLKFSLLFGSLCLIIIKILEYKSNVRPLFKYTYLNMPILIFVASVLLSTLFAKNFYDSQQIFFERILFYAAIFILVKETVDTKKKLYFILGVFAFTALIAGADGLWQYFKGHDLFFGYPANGGISGPFGSHSYFPGYLENTLPLVIFLCFVKKSKYLSGVLFIILPLLLFCWVYAFEREPWVSVSAAVIIVSLFINRKYAIIFIAALILIGIAFPPYASLRVKRSFKKGWDSHRIVIWEEALRLWKERPVFGWGMGGYERDNKLNLPNILHAHNVYLELLSDTGIVGLLAFLYLMGVFLAHSFRDITGAKDRNDKLILAGLVSSCISSFIGGLVTTNIIVGVGFSSMFWIIITSTSIYPQLAEKERLLDS